MFSRAWVLDICMGWWMLGCSGRGLSRLFRSEGGNACDCGASRRQASTTTKSRRHHNQSRHPHQDCTTDDAKKHWEAIPKTDLKASTPKLALNPESCKPNSKHQSLTPWALDLFTLNFKLQSLNRKPQTPQLQTSLNPNPKQPETKPKTRNPHLD